MDVAEVSIYQVEKRILPTEEALEHDHDETEFPAGTYCFALVMLVIGLAMIALGFLDDFANTDPAKGATFWILGVLLATPAFYYSFRMSNALRAEGHERNQILSSLPFY